MCAGPSTPSLGASWSIASGATDHFGFEDGSTWMEYGSMVLVFESKSFFFFYSWQSLAVVGQSLAVERVEVPSKPSQAVVPQSPREKSTSWVSGERLDILVNHQ